MPITDILVIVSGAVLGLALFLGLLAVYDKVGRNKMWAAIIIVTISLAIIFKGNARREVFVVGIVLCALFWKINYWDEVLDRLDRRRR